MTVMTCWNLLWTQVTFNIFEWNLTFHKLLRIDTNYYDDINNDVATLQNFMLVLSLHIDVGKTWDYKCERCCIWLYRNVIDSLGYIYIDASFINKWINGLIF